MASNVRKVDFSGGMNRAQPPQLLAPSQCALSINVDMRYRHLRPIPQFQPVDAPKSSFFNSGHWKAYPLRLEDGSYIYVPSEDGMFHVEQGKAYTLSRGMLIYYKLDDPTGSPYRANLPTDDGDTFPGGSGGDGYVWANVHRTYRHHTGMMIGYEPPDLTDVLYSEMVRELYNSKYKNKLIQLVGSEKSAKDIMKGYVDEAGVSMLVFGFLKVTDVDVNDLNEVAPIDRPYGVKSHNINTIQGLYLSHHLSKYRENREAKCNIDVDASDMITTDIGTYGMVGVFWEDPETGMKSRIFGHLNMRPKPSSPPTPDNPWTYMASVYPESMVEDGNGLPLGVGSKYARRGVMRLQYLRVDDAKSITPTTFYNWALPPADGLVRKLALKGGFMPNIQSNSGAYDSWGVLITDHVSFSNQPEYTWNGSSWSLTRYDNPLSGGTSQILNPLPKTTFEISQSDLITPKYGTDCYDSYGKLRPECTWGWNFVWFGQSIMGGIFDDVADGSRILPVLGADELEQPIHDLGKFKHLKKTKLRYWAVTEDGTRIHYTTYSDVHSWAPLNYIKVSGDYIGYCPYNDGILIATTTGVYYVSDGRGGMTLTQVSDYGGCVSPYAIGTVKGIPFIVGMDGIYQLTQTGVENITALTTLKCVYSDLDNDNIAQDIVFGSDAIYVYHQARYEVNDDGELRNKNQIHQYNISNQGIELAIIEPEIDGKWVGSLSWDTRHGLLISAARFAGDTLYSEVSLYSQHVDFVDIGIDPQYETFKFISQRLDSTSIRELVKIVVRGDGAYKIKLQQFGSDGIMKEQLLTPKNKTLVEYQVLAESRNSVGLQIAIEGKGDVYELALVMKDTTTSVNPELKRPII